MPDFILDACLDVVEDQKEYITTFFHDIFRLNGWRVVLGGTTMMDQIRKKESLLGVVNQLRDCKRVKIEPIMTVDSREHEISLSIEKVCGKIPNECDDIHIIALCSVSGCSNVLTRDHRIRVCIDKVRDKVGHKLIPTIRIISNEATYRQLKKKNLL